MQKFSPAEVLSRLLDAGVPVDGVSADGRIDFTETATKQQREAAAALIAGLDAEEPPVKNVEVTKEEILQAKTIDDLKTILTKLIETRTP